jgi:Fic family protein
MRAGRYVQQLQGYRAFIPAPLPPVPPLNLDGALTQLLSIADRALGRLDGVASILPNPSLFVAMYVRHEAVLSSQIEGTQSTLEDVLEYEMDAQGAAHRVKDAEEVVNYVGAMNYGLGRLETLPLSLRLLREIHERLMQGVRGGERSPGEFRITQNWIGPQGGTLRTATFIPPPPHEMAQALDNLEKFLHEAGTLPVLIQCGLAHAQFETIHPFLDGNGRVGRLLITLLLCVGKALERPLLYLSVYLKAHRAEYYDRLTAIRSEGDWEGWLRFFLRGVAEVSVSATNTAKAILQLREEARQRLANSALGLRLLDHLFERPLISVRAAEAFLGCSYVTAASLIEQMEKLGLLKETTGQKRNKLYRYEPYLAIFEQQGLSTASSDSAPSTEQAPKDS